MEKEVMESAKEIKDGSGTAPKPEKKASSRPATRRLVQLYAALLYNANLKGFIDGHIYSGPLKSACVPGFNCYSCPGAIASCPLGSLQNALNAAHHTAPWYMLGILSLFGVILGRTICGWICPLGLIQELLHKLPVPKIKKSIVTRGLSYMKYVFLVVFAIAIPIWYGFNKGIPFPGFCKYICPAGTFEGAVGLLQNKANATSFYQLKILFTRKWVIMLVIGLACAFCYRSFCRFICPLGAIYGFFNRFSLVGVKVDTDRCNGCGLCVRNCWMDVKHIGDHECISCAKCMNTCAQGAISLKAGKVTLAGPVKGRNADPEPVIEKRRKTGRIIWGAAIAVLLFALAWFNLIQPAREKAASAQPEKEAAVSESENIGETAASLADTEADEASTADMAETKSAEEPAAEPAAAEKPAAAGPAAAEESSAAKPASEEKPAASGRTGTAVGDILPDFSTELLGGGEFRLADYRGQVVIINLWAITCAPCIEELPYYEQLKAAHPEVEILAIHHRAGAKKADEFLSDKGWDHLDFALDSKEKGIYTLLEASDALPQTIILNKKGEIIYNAQAPLTYAQLESLAAAADASAAAEETAAAESTEAEESTAVKPASEEEPAAAGSAAAEEPAAEEPAAAEESSAAKPASEEEPAAAGRTGTAVGDLLPDFSTELLHGGEFRLADYRGQVVIINLWAITCAPCIEELPYYEQLKAAHPEVEILAIHHRAGAKKADEFLSDKGWDHLDFALDSKEKGLYTLLEASDALPQTIVLNKKGEIIYNVQAPLTYAQLESLVEKAS